MTKTTLTLSLDDLKSNGRSSASIESVAGVYQSVIVFIPTPQGLVWSKPIPLKDLPDPITVLDLLKLAEKQD
jgi:hypothetical protein